MNSFPATSDVLRSSTPVLALGDLNDLLVATDRDFLYTQCRPGERRHAQYFFTTSTRATVSMLTPSLQVVGKPDEAGVLRSHGI